MPTQMIHTAFKVIFITIMFALRSNAAVEIDLRPVANGDVEAVFLQDLSLSGMIPSAALFSATVRSDESIEEAYFVLSLACDDEEILSGRSSVFQLRPGIVELTNLDLSNADSPFHMGDFVLQPGADAIRQHLLTHGYLRAGTYNLRLEVFRPATESIALAHSEFRVTLTNPFDVTLRSPGGTPGDPDQIGEVTPVFTWTSPAERFILEIREGGTEARESGLVYRTPAAAPLQDKSFLYPGSGVQPLEFNRTYFWQVAVLIRTASGDRRFYSPVGAFSIVAAPGPEARRILDSLERLLGRDYQRVAAELAGYKPSGAIFLDGQMISIDEMEKIAKLFEHGQYRTLSVDLE
jgi:hypothetical protein